jgi:hypothetical protein
VDELDALVDPGDRAYVAQIQDDALRATVVASLLRHRVPERLGVGDQVPPVVLYPVDAGAPVELASLLRGRPALLVFGSFT